MIIEKIKKNKYVAIAIAIGTIVIAIATFFNAISTIFSPITKDNGEIIVDFKLASYQDSEVQKIININDDFKYIEEDTKKVIPNSDYLTGFYKDKFLNIPDLGYYESPSFHSIHYPTFDLKIINNTNKTIVLDKIIVDVEFSKVDTKPLLYLYTAADDDDRFSLSMINEGWGKWKNCNIRFNLNPTKSSINDFKQNNTSFNYSIELLYFESKYKIDLASYLEKEGVNINFLKEQIKNEVYVSSDNEKEFLNALGKFSEYKEDYNYYAFIEGVMVITDYNNQNYNLNFTGKILLTPPELGGALELFDKYNIKLKTEGENYQIDYPISISLRPNEPERLLITVAADKSSNHKFQVQLGNINGVTINTNSVELEMFLPRTSYLVFNKK